MADTTAAEKAVANEKRQVNPPEVPAHPGTLTEPTPERDVLPGDGTTGVEVPTAWENGVVVTLHNGVFHWYPIPELVAGIAREAQTQVTAEQLALWAEAQRAREVAANPKASTAKK